MAFKITLFTGCTLNNGCEVNWDDKTALYIYLYRKINIKNEQV